MIIFENKTIPTKGYILKNWNMSGYKATAISYLKRENLNSVEHINGNWYTLKMLENALVRS